MTKFFSKRVGTPNRIILWGSSMGTTVALKSIEKYADIYDGVIVFSHLGAGTPLTFDAALSIALAYDVVLGWPESWGSVGDVRDDLNFEWEVVPHILGNLYSFNEYGTPTSLKIENYGKFEFLRLVNHLSYVGFYNGEVPMDFWLLGDMMFATAGRAELEARAGGPVAQNLNHVYGLTNDDKEYLKRLGVDPNTIENWLADMNARTNIEADQSARNYLKKYADFTGDLERPVLTIVPKGDGMTVPANSSVYQKTVERVNKSHFLVQKYTNGSQHVGFTPKQVMAAFEAMEDWLDTGNRPGSEFFPEDLGFDNDYTPPPWPQPTD